MAEFSKPAWSLQGQRLGLDGVVVGVSGGRDWGQEEKWMTEDEMAGWHHRLDGCESE